VFSFTNVVKCGEEKRRHMKARQRRAGRAVKPTVAPSVRATISFPSELYETLEGIAKQKKVSLAWIVREATEGYIADKWPLFSRTTADQQ
jgi:hypothetical protein